MREVTDETQETRPRPGARPPERRLRRTVFYISGFDPRGPNHYHQLYRAEAAKQAAVNGLTLAVGPRRPVDACEVEWPVESSASTTRYRFLRYDDIVRRRWPRGPMAVIAAIFTYAWHFLSKGAFGTILRNSWPAFIAVTYPPALVLGLALLGAMTGAIAAAFMPGLSGWWPLAMALGAVGLPALVHPVLERRLNASWLARSCAFLVQRSRGLVPEVEERCLAFAQRIAAAVESGDDDEVLVVGHSVGTHLAVTVAARVLERSPGGRRLSLLTLGQAIAMTSRAPAAAQFRADLLAVAMSPRVDWIDVTSAVDGSCIALSDPVALSGIARPEGAPVQPKLVSARFNALFTPATYARIRRDFMRTHFQYLMAAELAGDYDYFLITAGNATLPERFAHRESVTGFNRLRLRQP